MNREDAQKLVVIERNRQIFKEGFTPEHDDAHIHRELFWAALSYRFHGTRDSPELRPNGTPITWDFEPEWWKPRDRLSNLVRAGALLVAERGRLLSLSYACRKGGASAAVLQAIDTDCREVSANLNAVYDEIVSHSISETIHG